MNVMRATSARALRRLRNDALKAGDLQAASAIKKAQAERKVGLNAAAMATLASVGLAVDSRTMRSTFPVESRLCNCKYRAFQNLKGESRKHSSASDLVKRSEFDKPNYTAVGRIGAKFTSDAPPEERARISAFLDEAMLRGIAKSAE